MEITYVKELEDWRELTNEKYPNFIQIVCYNIKKIFRICKTIKIDKNTKLIVLPYSIQELDKKQKWYRKILNKEKNIVLSKKIFKYTKISSIESKIWDGKWLASYLVLEILEYISKKTGIQLEKMSIAIIANETTEENIQTVMEVALKVKNLSIITNNIIKFRQLENKIYEQRGIAIKLSNNKKKSLQKEKIIINMDMNQEEINKYRINRKAIILNIKETVNKLPKEFVGISINQYEILTKDKKYINGFFYSHQYEAQMYKKVTFKDIKNKLEKDEIKINYLVGTRGIIQDQEYYRIN